MSRSDPSSGESRELKHLKEKGKKETSKASHMDSKSYTTKRRSHLCYGSIYGTDDEDGETLKLKGLQQVINKSIAAMDYQIYLSEDSSQN